MVVLNRIYTRTGDDGTTALGNGERRKKYDLRIEAYGTLDEVNAVMGTTGMTPHTPVSQMDDNRNLLLKETHSRRIWQETEQGKN